MKEYRKEQQVDDYIRGLPDWQQAICMQVRDLVHSADKDVEEVIKRTVQPYFVLNGNICALLAAKTHVNIFIYDPTVPDPDRIINQGHNNLTAKSIQISEGESLNRVALLAMFKTIIANNRAGGWRKLST
jgi:hypothetical protein